MVFAQEATMTSRILLGALALSMAGCATTPTFSYIDGNRWYKAELNSYSVVVLDVDGVSYTRNPVMVDPGVHVIRVQGPPAPGFRYGEDKTLTVDVKPCMRYYLKAVKKTSVEQDYTPAVDYVDPISGCK
jgi:hypothetical protein